MRLKIKYWYRILCMDIEDPAKQYYERQLSKMSVLSWDEDLKEEQWEYGATLVRRQQHDYCLKGISQLVKE